MKSKKNQLNIFQDFKFFDFFKNFQKLEIKKKIYKKSTS